MSHSVRLLRRVLAVSGAAACALTLPVAASAAQRLETIEVPSTKGNIDLSQVKLNKVTDLKATVLLPDGYDEDPSKTWPVVYLLAGIGDNHTGWITSGQVQTLTKGVPSIVVLPESGRGFLVDWWKGGTRSGANWGSYTLQEVIPAIHARYRVKPGRQYHALGGISMGAYGALLLGGQLPGYFGTIVSLSALADSQNPESFAALPKDAGASSYDEIWGPLYGQYATVNNPIKVPENLANSRVYLHSGNGVVDPFVPFNPDAWTKGAVIEGFAFGQNTRYQLALKSQGVQHVYKVRVGVHDWPYWRRELPRAIDWGIFNAPRYTSTAAATKWQYKTMAPKGNAWGLGFQFAAPPSAVVSIERSGSTIKVGSSNNATVTINPGAAEWDASGAGSKPECSFTAKLPVTRTLPTTCF